VPAGCAAVANCGYIYPGCSAHAVTHNAVTLLMLSLDWSLTRTLLVCVSPSPSPSPPHTHHLTQARPLTAQDFPLPTLGSVLHRMRHDVHWGRGFALLRGIPVERYTPLQSALAYWGIGTYWGNAVRQNKKGHLLGHVKVGGGALGGWKGGNSQGGGQMALHPADPPR
jgi:hypothetical protein